MLSFHIEFIFWFLAALGKKNYFSACSKRRRMRTTFTQHQLYVLENTFQKSHYPDTVLRERLTIFTGLPESRIQVSGRLFESRIQDSLKHLRWKQPQLLAFNSLHKKFHTDVWNGPKYVTLLKKEVWTRGKIYRGINKCLLNSN